MLDNLLETGNATDDAHVITPGFPDAAAEAEYDLWIDDSRRAHAAEQDAAYAEYLASEARQRQLWGERSYSAFYADKAAQRRAEARVARDEADATPEQDSGEDDGRDWEYIERSMEFYAGLGVSRNG
jgi:hypothetical protein